MLGGSRQRTRSEKSNFAETCNLLSRYMKEKGSLRDLNLEIGGKIESLEAIVKPGSTHDFASASTRVNHVLSDNGKSVEQSKSKEAAAELTIFYSGKVLVFDECPADKAKQLIAFAEKQSSQSQMSCAILSNTLGEKRSSGPTGLPPRPKAVAVEKINSGGGGRAKQSADLPIARRSSLHRFLHKRKDRAAVRGPYHDRVEEQEKQPLLATAINSLSSDYNILICSFVLN